MAALLADLERDPSKARWRVLGAALVVGLAGLAASRFVWPPRAAPVCRGGEERLAGVWDAAVKARVRATFEATGRPYSTDTASRVEVILDERARAWVAMYTDSCEATQVRGEQSPHLLDLRAHCLDRRRAELSALGALLSSEPAPDLLDRAVPLARSLSSLDDCQRTDRLLEAVPLPADPAVRARLSQLRARLEEARALRTAKRHAVGLPIAAAVVDEATTLDHAPLLAEALALRGRLQLDAGDFKESEATLREAAKIAARAREDRLAATVWTDLVHVIGARQRRDAEAAALVPVAESAVERAGGDALPKAELLDITANLLRLQGSHPAAMAKAEQAVVLFEQARGPDDLLLAGALDTLGSIYNHLARYGDAEARHERALAIRERVLGPGHPDIARALVNLANALYGRGKLREARSRYERALAIQEKALGPEHPYLTIVLNNLGSLLSDLGDHEGALSLHRRTLAIAVRQYGAEHVEPSISHHNIGVVLDLQEKPAEAQPHYERALALRDKFLGREHIQTALTLGRLGKVLCEQGAEREGREKLERTIAIHEKAVGKDDPNLVKPLLWLAECDLRARKGPAALVRLERALALQLAAGEDGDPVELADVQVVLARALWDAGKDRKRAVSLMEKAAATYAAEEELYAKELARARGWIKAHP